METLVAVVHILVALVLIVLVLVQDSKSGSIGGAFGGGGSNSVFGATGATTLAQKMTRYTAIVFAGTCIMLTIYSSRTHKSVLDSMGAAAIPAPAAGGMTGGTTSTEGAAPATSPAPADAAAPANSTSPSATPAATEPKK